MYLCKYKYKAYRNNLLLYYLPRSLVICFERAVITIIHLKQRLVSLFSIIYQIAQYPQPCTYINTIYIYIQY